MSRLQGVSTSHFKVNPQTTSSVGPNNLIRFELPSNTLLNFRSIRLLFNATATGTGVSLPNDISSLIERVSVYIGGVLVANGFNGYNTLVHGKAALQGYKCGTLSHPEMIRKINYHVGQTTVASYTADGGGEVITDLSGATVTDSDGTYFFCIDNFEGFLGSIEPSIMDTGLVSTIVIEIALADATVCSVSGSRALPTLIAANTIVGTGGFDLSGGGTPTYTVSNLTMQVEVLSLATNVIDTIVEQRVAQVGYLSIPFKNYFSFTNNHTNTTRFNVNSASWDRLWIVYRDKNYATKAAPVRIKGHKVAGSFVSIAAANDNATNFDIGVPEYDFGGVLNTNAEKYKPFYFNFIEKKAAVTTRSTYQLQINSANVPSYPLTAPEAYAMSMNSLDYYDKNHKISLHQYKMNYFVQCFRFCLPDSDYSRLASGLDCRGVSSSCSLNTVGVDECNVTMFAECTSELRVGAGRQLEVIV
jgi:hypothetical protein